MRLFIFASIFLLVFALLNLYIVKRFINKIHLNTKYKRYMKLFLLINYIGIVGYMYARYNPSIPNWLFLLLSLPIGIVFLTFIIAILYDITHLFIKKIPLKKTRREFLKKTLDYSTLAVALGVSGRAIYEAKTIELEKVDIKINNLKRPFSIVQLSDIHIGGLIDQKFIKEIVERVNTLNPDIVVITGDLVDISLDYAKEALEELTHLKTKYGTYFIVGNHEYLHGIDEIISTVNALGIKTLENENVYIGEETSGFNLAGVYDYMGYRTNHHLPDIKKALQSANIHKDAPIVLLAHQPRYIEEITEDLGVDLVLSGHTHGGQLYPFKALVKIVQPYLAGLYKHNDTTQIYVNKGTGFWGPPMRLGASSEITYITLSSSIIK